MGSREGVRIVGIALNREVVVGAILVASGRAKGSDGAIVCRGELKTFQAW